ncbi:MAG: GNAT family N-acetyltransferase [Ilumatobacteraceae bacterium]
MSIATSKSSPKWHQPSAFNDGGVRGPARVAIDNSSMVVTARAPDGRLLGLARGMSDDSSIFYLQDILVNPDQQRRGLGRRMLGICLERYAHVRQKVLLTDDLPTSRFSTDRSGIGIEMTVARSMFGITTTAEDGTCPRSSRGI